MKHVVFLQDSTCSITIVIYIWKKYCVIGSVVTHRPTVAKDASSRLAQSKGHFVLPKNCPQCMCTYIYNRYVFVYFMFFLYILFQTQRHNKKCIYIPITNKEFGQRQPKMPTM